VPHLRQIMLEELERRNYAPGTITSYIRTVEHFARHFHRAPDQLGPEPQSDRKYIRPTPESGSLQVAISEAPPERLLLDKLHATGAPDTALRLHGHFTPRRFGVITESLQSTSAFPGTLQSQKNRIGNIVEPI